MIRTLTLALILLTITPAIAPAFAQETNTQAHSHDGMSHENMANDDNTVGAKMTIKAELDEMAQVKGLGFFGVMTIGAHHQMHHLMIARGQNPHHH